MKRLVLFICLLFVPLLVNAQEYQINDLTVDIASSWEVYTRDNVVGNEKLAERGLDGRDVLKNMESNYMYMDMLRIEGNNVVEGFVFIKDVASDGIMNLHKYSDKEVLEVGKKAYNQYDPNTLKVYTANGYKFVYVEYLGSLNGASMGIIDYYTVINGKGYTFKFQSTQSLVDYKESFKKIIDSTHFKVEEKYEKNPQSKSLLQRLIVPIVVTVVCAVVGVLAGIVSKKKNNQPMLYQQMPQPMMNQPMPQQPNVMNNQPVQQQVFGEQDVQNAVNNYNNDNHGNF